jgi:tetratricopeptide (TPR) repeat protein/predicted Ser/Thr protein kinase
MARTLKKNQVLSSRYRIIRELNAGGMGTIYEAVDLRLNALVAVKENCLAEESRRQAFRREAQFLANLSHPSLPRVIDYFQAKGVQYLVMQLIEGPDLAVLLAARQGVPVEGVVEIARQLLDLLVYLHGQSVPVLHRDIKPANIKIRNGFVFLLDFGLAYGQSGEMSTFVSNQFNWEGRSPNYAPPEQFQNEPTSPASDLFSLAATLYVLLTGVRPANAERRLAAISRNEPDPLLDIRVCMPDLDANFAGVIMRGLALKPNDRPQSADTMLAQMFPPAAEQSNVQPKQRTKKPRAFAALALVSVVLIGAGFYYRTAACGSSGRLFAARFLRCQAPVESSDAASKALSAELLAQSKAEAEQLKEDGKYEQAKEKAQAILSQAPDDGFARFIYGDALCEEQFERVEDVAQLPAVKEQARLITAMPHSPQTADDYVARAWADLVTKKLDSAVANATEALRLQPGSISALMIRATAMSTNAATDTKHALESLADYDEIIRLRPNYVVAWGNRASTFANLGFDQLAISDFAKAISLMPRASFHAGRGTSFLKIHEYDNARQEYQSALLCNRDFAPAYLGLAAIDVAKENWSGAINNYTEAIKIHPTSPALFGRGVANNQSQRFPEAVRDFSQAIKRDHDDYRSFGFRAYARAQLTLWDDAIADYTQALALAPDSDYVFESFVYKNRAEAFRSRGEENLAKSDERRVRELLARS